jgi:hypothetical protein
MVVLHPVIEAVFPLTVDPADIDEHPYVKTVKDYGILVSRDLAHPRLVRMRCPFGFAPILRISALHHKICLREQ